MEGGGGGTDGAKKKQRDGPKNMRGKAINVISKVAC